MGTTHSFEQFTEVWNRVLDPQPMQDNALIETLSKAYRLALLSNTDPIHVPYMEANYDFFRFFPKGSCTEPSAGVSAPVSVSATGVIC